MSAARSSTMPAPPGSSRPADEQRTGTDMDDEGREMQKAKNSVLKIQRAKKEEGEHGRPPKIDVQTLYVLYMVLFMMIWMSLFRFRYPQHAEFLRYTPAVEALAACFFFTFVTVMLQALLANALSEKPAPSPLPPPVNQWIMGISVWMSGVLYYLVYASMSDGYAVEPGYSGLLIAGVASVVSLALTVYNMLQRPVFA